MIANLRLNLEVEIQAGNQSASSYSAPGLWSLLERIPKLHWPRFIRCDCDWGNDGIMTEAEQRGVDYLFKLGQSKYVKKLIWENHFKPGWERTICSSAIVLDQGKVVEAGKLEKLLHRPQSETLRVFRNHIHTKLDRTKEG